MKFVVILPDGARLQHLASAGVISIGRSRSNVLVVPDPQLSRHHAEIRSLDDGTWQVRDLGSLNGTLLNDEPLESPQSLREGDRITLGSSAIHVGEPREPARFDLGALSLIGVTEGTIHSLPAEGAAAQNLSRLVFEAARALVDAADTRTVLGRILDLALQATRAERGLIAELTGGETLTPLAAVPAWEGGDPPWISREVQARVLGRGESVIVEDIAHDESLRGRETIVGAQVRSILCAPLGQGESRRGIFYLDSVAQKARFETSHLEVVTVLAGLAHLAMEAEQARRDAERKRVLEAELEAAVAIQASLLPSSDPECPQGFSAAGGHRACRGVGGDVFDFFGWGERGYGVMVADVAGKGLSAALIGSNLLARWKSVLCSGQPVATWLARLNDELCDLLPENRFVTLAFAVADADSGTLRYASAGQTSLLVHGDELRDLAGTGPVLGLFPGLDFGMSEISFGEGDRLLLFTDGLTDQASESSDPFDLEGLKRTLFGAARVSNSARETLDMVFRAFDGHAGEAVLGDDTTVVVLARDVSRG